MLLWRQCTDGTFSILKIYAWLVWEKCVKKDITDIDTHTFCIIPLINQFCIMLPLKTCFPFPFPLCMCQSVVNFISELQEQMCRFQKEINSRIQEKMALEAPGDRSSQVVFLHPAGSTKAQSSNLRLSCDRSPEVMHKLEEVPDTADANTNILGESSPDTQQQCYCGSQSVGTACLHDLWPTAWVIFVVCNLMVQVQHAHSKYPHRQQCSSPWDLKTH